MTTGIVFADGPQKVDDGAVTTNTTLTLKTTVQPGKGEGREIGDLRFEIAGEYIKREHVRKL